MDVSSVCLFIFKAIDYVVHIEAHERSQNAGCGINRCNRSMSVGLHVDIETCYGKFCQFLSLVVLQPSLSSFE